MVISESEAEAASEQSDSAKGQVCEPNRLNGSVESVCRSRCCNCCCLRLAGCLTSTVEPAQRLSSVLQVQDSSSSSSGSNDCGFNWTRNENKCKAISRSSGSHRTNRNIRNNNIRISSSRRVGTTTNARPFTPPTTTNTKLLLLTQNARYAEEHQPELAAARALPSPVPSDLIVNLRPCSAAAPPFGPKGRQCHWLASILLLMLLVGQVEPTRQQLANLNNNRGLVSGATNRSRVLRQIEQPNQPSQSSVPYKTCKCQFKDSN